MPGFNDVMLRLQQQHSASNGEGDGGQRFDPMASDLCECVWAAKDSNRCTDLVDGYLSDTGEQGTG